MLNHETKGIRLRVTKILADVREKPIIEKPNRNDCQPETVVTVAGSSVCFRLFLFPRSRAQCFV